MQVVHLDTETKSRIDPNVQGYDALAKNCEIDLLTWGVAPDFVTLPTVIHCWDSSSGPMPAELLTLLQDSSNWFIAFNSGFDEQVIKTATGIHYENNWLDSGVAAAMYGYSVGKLEHLAKVLKCKHQKIELLPGLMKLFCGATLYGTAKTYRGRKLYLDKDCTQVDPEYYAELRAAYVDYGKTDTLVSAEIFTTCMSWGEPYPIADFLLHQKINRRGIKADLVFTNKMALLVEQLKQDGKDRLNAMCAVDYNVASHPGFGRLLSEAVAGWDKGSSKDVIMLLAANRKEEFGENDAIATACALKVAVTGTAGAKYKKLLSNINDDGRLYNTLRFDGAARTGRPTGSGVQMLNLPRPYKVKKSDEAHKYADMSLLDWVDKYGYEASDVAAKIFRAAFVPEEGYVFADFDFSSIESVIMTETTRDKEALRIRKAGLDAYVAFGTKMFNKTYEEIMEDKANGGILRQQSKPPVLGCAYGLSGPGLQDYAKGMGQYFTLAFSVDAVATWRETHTDMVDSWAYMEEMFELMIESPVGATLPLSKRIVGNPNVLERHKDAVVMRLPCGRGIWYREPHIATHEVPYRDKVTGEAMVFETNSFTYLNNKGTKSWHEGTHGGKFSGNSSQALGNSLLRDWMRNIDDAGVPIVLHVYDQVLAEIPENRKDWASDVIQAANPGVADMNHWSAGWKVGMDGGILNRFWK